MKVHISVMVELKKKHSELSKKCFESKEQEEKALAEAVAAKQELNL